jgi:hypothetical protein
VLVERVEGFCSEPLWNFAYGEINDFEDQLTGHGYALCKFWLHVDPDEQVITWSIYAHTPPPPSSPILLFLLLSFSLLLLPLQRFLLCFVSALSFSTPKLVSLHARIFLTHTQCVLLTLRDRSCTHTLIFYLILNDVHYSEIVLPFFSLFSVLSFAPLILLCVNAFHATAAFGVVVCLCIPRPPLLLVCGFLTHTLTPTNLSLDVTLTAAAVRRA